MLVWDAWGMQLGINPGSVAEQDAALLDEICAQPADPGVAPDVVAALADRDELHVPAGRRPSVRKVVGPVVAFGDGVGGGRGYWLHGL